MERKDAVGVASCPEWYGPFCCTGLEQLFYSHSNNPSWVYWLSRKGNGDGKNVNERVWLLPKALRLKLTSPCILWPWATFHCNYLVLLQPFWSKGQYTNVCDIACIFIFPVWKWKKKEGGEKLHAVSRAGQGTKPELHCPFAPCCHCSPCFLMPEIGRTALAEFKMRLYFYKYNPGCLSLKGKT